MCNAVVLFDAEMVDGALHDMIIVFYRIIDYTRRENFITGRDIGFAY